MDELQLDPEETEILEAYERGELVQVPDVEAEIERYRSYATSQLKKDRRVNIRLSQADLSALQTIALEEGIPYQTLMASILHKYVTGRLVERPRTSPAATYVLRDGE
jgi:predicted DNA binding CopG/RHH family protein